MNKMSTKIYKSKLANELKILKLVW